MTLTFGAEKTTDLLNSMTVPTEMILRSLRETGMPQDADPIAYIRECFGASSAMETAFRKARGR